MDVPTLAIITVLYGVNIDMKLLMEATRLVSVNTFVSGQANTDGPVELVIMQ